MASYKKEVEQLRLEKTNLENKIKRFEEAEKKRNAGFKCMVYCSHCQTVGRVSVPKGVDIHMSGCAWCGKTMSSYLVTNNQL